MNVICKDKKKFSLTVDKPYEVLEENNSRFTIINDNGKTQKYSKLLFEEEVIVPDESTSNNIIETISISDQIIFVVDGEEVSVENITLSEDTEMSCGVHQTYNISGLIDDLIKVLPERDNLRNEVIAYIVKEVLVLHEQEDSCAFRLLSTNTNSTNYSYVENALDHLTTRKMTSHNPSSKNEITLWVVLGASLRN
jgi:hypothetical protein